MSAEEKRAIENRHALYPFMIVPLHAYIFIDTSCEI